VTEQAKFKFVQADVFSLPFTSKFDLVYADPPYAACRFKYARRVASRQWGRDARADFMRELIAVVERHRGKVGAISMTSREALRLGHLFPSDARVLAWVKPYAVMRPGVSPVYAWEPIVVWGELPKPSKEIATPKDWYQGAPKRPKKGDHENPKPEQMIAWLLSITRPETTLELFAGSAPLSRLTGGVAVDLEVFPWR